jgi:hypothetical protein
MGSLSTAEQRKLAYFHALGKVMTENTQGVYESLYKSSHNVRSNEIWSDEISYADTYNDALTESNSNDAVTIHYNVTLSSIFGSNNQAYNYYVGSVFIRPWISPVDVPDEITNAPSNGYLVRLFRGSDATSGIPNSEIFQSEGAWSVDYYAGIIHFAEGSTPVDLGWGTIKGTFFQYTGQFGTSSGSTSGDAYVSVSFDSGTTELVFNSGETNETIVDLSYLVDSDAFTTADYNDTTNTVIFNSGATNETIIDLSSLKTTSGTTSAISTSNVNMTVSATSSLSPQACSTPLINGNVTNSMVAVFVNGIQINVGNSVNDDCYFLNASTLTKRPRGQEKAGDYLYWNYNGINPVIGYELNPLTDKITFLHLTLN